MDPVIAAAFNQLLVSHTADQQEAVGRRRDSSQHASDRQRDQSMYELAQLRAFATATLFQSDDAERFASLNAGIRTPTTLDHPNAVVAK